MSPDLPVFIVDVNPAAVISPNRKKKVKGNSTTHVLLSLTYCGEESQDDQRDRFRQVETVNIDELETDSRDNVKIGLH